MGEVVLRDVMSERDRLIVVVVAGGVSRRRRRSVVQRFCCLHKFTQFSDSPVKIRVQVRSGVW